MPDELNYGNVVATLLQEFPEYKASSRYYNAENLDLPYVMLGCLCTMAFENIDDRRDTALAERLLTLTDHVMNNPATESDLINLFAVEVFETLVGSRTGAKLAKKYLHGKSLEHLEQTLQHFHTPEFLEEYRR